ncbi:hypothetical protein BD770DRAFT_381534 [Pilaira anomala]|nr:hypothetical protein BD770DRAFT_381534 [Pilaira anomala]
MEEVYDLHQHAYCIFIQLESSGKINWQIDSNIANKGGLNDERNSTTDYLMYDERNMEIVYWKCPPEYYAPELRERLENNRHCKNRAYITIKHFIDKLYCAFKKGKNNWNKNDLILELAVKNFIRALANYIIDSYSFPTIHSLIELHYVCIVPYEWEDEIREELLRPIFIQSGLITKTDHKDRLLFLSEPESFFYYTQRNNRPRSELYNGYYQVGDHYLLCRVDVDHKRKSSIHVHLIEAQPTVLNIPEELLYPRILFSSKLSFTVDSIKSNLNFFLRAKLFPEDNNSYKNDYVDMIVKYLYKSIITGMYLFEESDYTDLTILKKPCIKVKKEWKLNETQSKYLETLSLFDICLETDRKMINTIKKGLYTSNNQAKQCKVLIFQEEWGVLNKTLHSLWSIAILEYIADSLNYINKSIIRFDGTYFSRINKALLGAQHYSQEVICNSDINSRPRILPSIEPTLSSSVFLDHKINAVLNIDILPGYTLLSCAFVNSNGIVEKVLDNHYFTNNKILPPLKLFYPVSEIATLVMNERCIPLINKHLSYNLNCMFDPDYYFQKTKKLAIKFGDILNEGFSSKEIFISTQEPKNIEAFLLLYFGYINEIILSGLSTQQLNSDSTRTRIGYLVSIEKRLLNSIVGTKEHLKELVFESGLVKNNDEYKKLRIITQGEGLLPAIQKQINLELPIKSCFVIAQLHENHVQLTLNQVVTDVGLEDEAQEAIILQDKIVPIENIYESLCISMWDKISRNTSLIQFCDLHCRDNEHLFELTAKNKFTESLREFISAKIFTGNLNLQMDNVRRMELSHTCHCAVNLSVRSILDISIRPFMYEMASLISSSIINRDYFGKYNEIEHIFSMIHFNRNQRFHPILVNLLKEELNDFNNDEKHSWVLLEVPNQLLQPVVHQRLVVYKSFQVGDLKQISNSNYGFLIDIYRLRYGGIEPLYRDQRYYTGSTFENSTLFIFLEKGDIINDASVNRVIYLTLPPICRETEVDITIYTYKIESLDGSTPDRTLLKKENADEKIDVHTLLVNFEEMPMEKNEIPLILSVEIKPYSSSLSFSAKIVGQELILVDGYPAKDVGTPMTLTRF